MSDELLQDSSSAFFRLFKGEVNGENTKESDLLPLFIYKGLVIDIDPDGKKYSELNPRWSLKVKVYQPIKFSEEKIIYPPSDFDSLPIAIGESIRFVFNDDSLKTGTFISRIITGKTEKVLATEYYKNNNDERSQSVDAFNDDTKPKEQITEARILNETPNYEVKETEVKGSEDRYMWGRKDAVVLRDNGNFEIGEGANKSAVLGEDLVTYLTDPAKGKITTIKGGLEILQAVMEGIVAILNALIAMPLLDPATKAALSPIVIKFNNDLNRLRNNLPILDEKGTYLSDKVKVK